MDSSCTTISTPNSNIGFTINFWECWVKVLRVVIVKCSRLTIVFFTNSHKSAYFFGWFIALHLFSITYCIQSWSVINTFFLSLCIIFCLFDWEAKFWFKSLYITPICSVISSFCVALFRSLHVEPFLPCLPSTKVVPVPVSVKRDTASDSPQNPSHLSYHPGICLPHVICNVKHHRLLFIIIIIN